MSQVLINDFRNQFEESHSWLNGVMEGVTDKLAKEQINPKAMSIGGQYVHIVTGIDGLVLGMVGGKTPLYKGEWEGKAGFAPNPPDSGDHFEWAKEVKLELAKVKQYCEVVHKAVDEFLASLSDEDIQQNHDLSSWGMGMKTKAYVIHLTLFNTMAHVGEISNMKGMRGLKGYPW